MRLCLLQPGGQVITVTAKLHPPLDEELETDFGGGRIVAQHLNLSREVSSYLNQLHEGVRERDRIMYCISSNKGLL